MQKEFYRKTEGARPPLFALWMLVVVSLSAPAALAAPDPDMALPPSSAPSLVQQVAMVIPHDLGRPPMPTRKPRERDQIARTSWDQGLNAYGRGDFQTALYAFAQTYQEPRHDNWQRAGAAFWAARAASQMGESELAYNYRTLAANYERTFYGQLARAQLGATSGLSWDLPDAAMPDMVRFKNHPLARSALAHVDAGRLSAADQVLQNIIHERDDGVRLAALTFALHHGLPATALKLAPTIERNTGTRFDAAYYPVGAWIDQNDFRVDRALVHAIIRQESSFNPRARSHQGAVGLMQLLPSTAKYMIKVRGGGVASGRDLTQSTHNLDMGQHYLEYLLDRPVVSGDIMKMLVAYNAGPGNLAKWQRDYADITDPLLFIEVIPSAETRGYVEKVMASYWIYRDRFGMDNPTLVSVASGQAAPLTPTSPTAWLADIGGNIRQYVGM